MKSVKSYSFEPKYRRDNGLVVLDINHLPLPSSFDLHETSFVHLPAGQIAGNHQHPRQEAYCCLDNGVELHWVDETGKVRIEQMAISGRTQKLFVIPPTVPHAVVNLSDKDVTLLGCADGPLEKVESVQVATPEPHASGGLSAQGTAQAAELLSKLTPGFLPFEIFHQVTRLTTTPIVEVVPLRETPTGKIEILLLKRETDDPVWPSQLHVPGTIIRATDTPGSFDDPLKRILSKELMDVKASEPTFVKSILHHSGRGMEASQIFWVEVYEAVIGKFYDADNLPDAVVKSQLDFIPDAISHFRDARR